MKTRQPLILTARIAEAELAPFERLREAHFPPERNRLHAHLAMFHRLPGEYLARIEENLLSHAQGTKIIVANVSGV